MTAILGLNAFHPDSSACLLIDGKLVGAVAEERLGSIEVGKYADLTVIDGDLFGMPPERIRDLEIWLTVISGEVVYGPEEAGVP